MNALAKTYELAHRPEFEDIMTATSHITGNKINRFTHIHQNIQDLVKKSKGGSANGSTSTSGRIRGFPRKTG